MVERGKSVKTWLNDNGNHLFMCPRLPGKLRLLRSACAKRFEMANRVKSPSFLARSRPDLKLCRNCQTGKLNLHKEGAIAPDMETRTKLRIRIF